MTKVWAGRPRNRGSTRIFCRGTDSSLATASRSVVVSAQPFIQQVLVYVDTVRLCCVRLGSVRLGSHIRLT